jgi:FkbM family methyltransferase
MTANLRLPYPASMTNIERIAMAARCLDTSIIPKVPDAGCVIEDGFGHRVQIMHNGLRVLADGYCGSWMTDLIRVCRGHHEPQEERFFHELLQHLPESATMLELGGYWSYYSLWFLLDHGQRQSLVLEPDASNLEVGIANARLNGLNPGFLNGSAGREYSPGVSFLTENNGPLVVPQYSVEYLLDMMGWSQLTLLHCDTQGAEVDILESSLGLLQDRRIEWVLVSTHARQITGSALTHQYCLDLLRRTGGIIEAEHDVHESFSGDGFIAARYCSRPRGWISVPLSFNRQAQSLFPPLAFDLEASLSEPGKRPSQTQGVSDTDVALHPSLAAKGTLLTLRTNGPLGRVGDDLLVPHDAVIAPAVRTTASWDLENFQAFLARTDAARRYTLIDIGANIGLFTRQLLMAAPHVAQALCVEPDPGNFRALTYNLLGFSDRVELHNVALGSADTVSEFYRDDENIGNYSLNPDAMRNRPFHSTVVEVRDAGRWMVEALGQIDGPLLWKSDTQGLDEMIIAQTPLAIWERLDVALIELWRIQKPDFDRNAFAARLDLFPHRLLNQARVSTSEVIDYLAGDDWQFADLLLWR